MIDQQKRKIYTAIIIMVGIGIPVGILFINLEFGVALLIPGIWFINRYFKIINADARRDFDIAVERKMDNATGRTIFVQVVDDFGRELPPKEVEKRMADARAQAHPRDTIVPVNFKV